ncbi:hypothetical protein LCGC14_2842040, partial [marine sediment metagenome]
DHASEEFRPDNDDATTIKGYLQALAGATMQGFTHTQSFTITFDATEESLLTSITPGDSFRVGFRETRLSVLKKLLDYVKSVARVEDDEQIHILNPTVSGSSFAYEYFLNVEDEHTYLYETNEIKSPLTNQDQVERDRKLMPEAVFARHYRNIVMRGASFLSDEDIEAIIKPTGAREHIEPMGAYVGCDWGLTKDKCAITNLLALDDGRFVFDKCHVFRGSKSEPVDLNDAADMAESLYEPGWTLSMLFDKWQAMSTIQRLQKKHGDDVIQGFDFTKTNRKRLFKNIFTVVRDGRLVVFSDILMDCWKQSCATCPDNLSCEECNAHDFLRELQGLRCDSDFNVTHGKRGDDITVATALALFYAVQEDVPQAAIWML